MREVVTGLVEQAVADAPAHDHAQHAEKENVLHILARPGTLARHVFEWRVVQSARAQKQEQTKGHQIGNAIPVHGQRANLHGYRINVRIHQHVRHCAAGR